MAGSRWLASSAARTRGYWCTMIRFVDLTNAYWTFPEDPECGRPICAFLDTITDRFIENAAGSHTCSDMEDVLSLGMTKPGDLGERCAGLLPSGFFGGGKAL